LLCVLFIYQDIKVEYLFFTYLLHIDYSCLFVYLRENFLTLRSIMANNKTESDRNTNQLTDSGRIHIPSEPVGSLPRPNELIDAQEQYSQGKIDIDSLNKLRVKAVQDSIINFEATGSPIITDGEQTKASFLNYPIESLAKEYYTYSGDCFALSFNDGHQRALPRLTKAPFKYGTFAHTYVDEAKKYTKLPIK
jgi:5-methyltetrahydropteroyltriglutamate--homocysteine methyltransferase